MVEATPEEFKKTQQQQNKPKEDPRLAIFAGESSESADLEALALAKAKSNEGEDPRKIWRDTGWFKGKDGKWRFEVDDSKASIVEGEIVHTELEKAYPGVFDEVSVFVEPLRSGLLGSFNPSTKEVKISSDLSLEEQLSTALHELQHYVQDKEGFSSGGSRLEMQLFQPFSELKRARRVFFDDVFMKKHPIFNQDKSDLAKAIEEKTEYKVPEDIVEKNYFDNNTILRDFFEEADPKDWEKFFGTSFSERAVEKIQQAESSEKTSTAFFEALKDSNPRIFSGINSYDDLLDYEEGDISYSEAFGKYKDVLGEAEARATEARQELTEEQRRDQFPKDTYDKPEVGTRYEETWIRPKIKIPFSEGGTVENQMNKLFEEGGMADDGMERDPVSGNEIPPGSTAKEVRDDVDVKLSEGEYVVPADVVQYYGVKFFEDLREKAKGDLEKMDEDGRIGGEPVMEDDELTPEEVQMLQEALGPQGMNEGGVVSQPTFSGYGGTNPTVPGAGSQFTGYGGTGAGFGSTGTEIRSYINPDTGQTRSFMFINGQPVGTIPEGFVPNTQENRERAQQTERQTQSVRTEGTRDDGPSFDTATRGSSESQQQGEDLGTSGVFSGDVEANLSGQISGPMQNAGLIGRAAGLVGTLAMGPLAGTLARGLATNVAESQSINQALETQALAETLGYKDVAEEARAKAQDLAESFDREITESDIAEARNNADAVFNAAVDPTQSTGLSRDAFGSDEAFRGAMESVAPTGMSVTPDGGGYERSGDAAPTSSVTPVGRPSSFSAPPSSSSSSSGGGSSVAGNFAANVAAGTAGTISMGEFGGGSSSGGSSSSSSSSGGSFADDPAGKDGPTGGAGSGGGGGGSGGGCVVATHAVSTGAFTPEDKQRAVDWCRKNLHGNWFGETFRKGYRRLGNKHIDNGTVKNYYTEFEDYVNFVTGKKRNLKGLLTFLYRTPQLFVLGLFTREK